jgi:Plavaka transposase
VIHLCWFQWGLTYSNSLLPFTHGFPKVDIHKLLAPELLHQLIKGMFKDHLVMWVGDCFVQTHGEVVALEIIEDIDHQ